MAITGVVGFRTLQYLNKKWVSAAYTGFEWTGPLMYSECRYCRKDKEGHTLIRYGCDCGIHATIWPDEFIDYITNENCVGMLVESIGHVSGIDWTFPHRGESIAHAWRHTYGFTSSGVLVVAIVNWNRHGEVIRPIEDRANINWTQRVISRQMLLMEQAAKFFQCDIVDYETARIVAKTMWEKDKVHKWPEIVDTARTHW